MEMRKCWWRPAKLARRGWEERMKMECACCNSHVPLKSGIDVPLSATLDRCRRVSSVTCRFALKHFGLENLGTMTCISTLASTYSELGRWAEAEQLNYLVLQTRKKALGLKHPETLISMNNLAGTYADQKRWKEAE